MTAGARTGRRVFLLGLMGAGKSSVGAALAELLGARFLDLDAELERAEGLSIPEMFARHGEAWFREREARRVEAALAEPGPLVASLGGGALSTPRTRRRLGAASACVWLRAPAEVLAARTSGDGRPLLAGLDRAGRIERLRALLEERTPAYREVATHEIEVQARLPDEVARDILGLLAGARRVPVLLSGGRGYEVVVSAGGLRELGAQLAALGVPRGPVGLVTDRNVQALYGEVAAQSLTAAGFSPVLGVLPPGEGAKCLEEVERLGESFSAAELDRRSVVVGLGGGAVTDVAGFTAACYRRGIDWIACPTTLIGAVDAAIGGKTGVNLRGGKNLLGAFWQPRRVLVDVRTLRTLGPRDVRSGLGEVLKTALLGPASLLAWVEARLSGLQDERGQLRDRQDHLVELVAETAGVKAGVVARDERETLGLRKTLNLGHTIGHAIEAAAGYGAISHGEAVLYGLRAAVWLSLRRGLLDRAHAPRLEALLGLVPLSPLSDEVPTDRILRHLRHDKKFEGGRRLFVLLRAPGDPVVDVEVSAEEVECAVAALRPGGAAWPLS